MDVFTPKGQKEYNKIGLFTHIEIAPDPVIVTDGEGRIVEVNKLALDLLEYSGEEIRGMWLGDVLQGGGTDPTLSLLEYLNHFGERLVCLGQRKSGGKFKVGVSSNFVEIGEEIFILIALREEFSQSMEVISIGKSLLNMLPDSVVIISTEGAVVSMNEAAEKLLAGQAVTPNAPFQELFARLEKADELLSLTFHFGRVSDFRLILKDPCVEVICNTSVFWDPKDMVQRIMAYIKVVTNEEKREQRIRVLNEELEQRIAELESFSYSVSHDLRAPLRGIDGFIAMFIKKYIDQVDDEGKRLLLRVRQNVDEMEKLIDELLTLSKVGMESLRFTNVDMERVAKLAVEETKSQIGKSRIEIKKLGMAQADPTLLKQVFVNLLSNALKFSEKSGRPRIEIGSLIKESERFYYIKDNGVGFDMEYSNKLFGVFQRLHDPKEYPGNGVGLAIVKRIINRHGGKVWAFGEEGKGATFYFSLKTAL